jgi:hypothetical protein
MVKVKAIQDMGAYVSLLEYNHIEVGCLVLPYLIFVPFLHCLPLSLMFFLNPFLLSCIS